MSDQDYHALVQIDRRMRNEISSLSISGSALNDYLKQMETSRLHINGTLKALSLLEQRMERKGDPASLEALHKWSQALLLAELYPQRRIFFENIDFDAPLEHEFSRDADRAKATLKEGSKSDWIFLVAFAIAVSLLLAGMVLLAHINFWIAFVICLFVYLLLAWWYYSIEAPRRYVRMLERLREGADSQTKRFLNAIRLKSYSVPYVPKRAKTE